MPEKVKNEELNFDVVYNMNVWKLEKCNSTRTAMKAWNGCVQYWFGVYIYKRFPLKSLRTFATLTLSAIWHGWSSGYFLCNCQIPLFLLSEDIIIKFYQQSKENSIVSFIFNIYSYIILYIYNIITFMTFITCVTFHFRPKNCGI